VPLLPIQGMGGAEEGSEGPRNMVVSIGTGPVGGNWFPLAAVVSTIINENVEGVRAAPTLGGAVANLNQLHSGDLEIGMTNAPTDVDGWEGREPFEKEMREARGMWMCYPEIHHVFALKDSGITSHEDLKGKKVSPMYKGSTGYVMNQRILGEYGMTTDDFGQTELIDYSGGAELLKDKHIDAYMINTMAPSAPFIDACTFREVVIFGPNAEVRKALVEKYPDLTELTIPRRYLSGQSATYGNCRIYVWL
jgi:TRAP transporter TAXI family solute receptor